MKKFNDNLSFYFLTGALALFLFFVFSPNVRAETVITDNIQADTTWTQDGNPYILQNNIDVALGVTLTIGPGVVVKFDPTANVSITVFGDLVVNGELGNEVYFTSNYDDMVGGDSNGDYFCDPELDDDGNQIGEMCETLFEPSRNDWQGINFIDSHNNYIKNAVFKYASDVAYLEHTYLNVKNIQISNSDYGLITNTSNVDANNINCADLTNSCLMAFSSSNVNWINSLIDTISNDAISIFNSSSLNISHTIIRNISGNSHNGISVFSDSSVVADYLDFSNGSLHGDYITVYDHSNLTLNNSTMMGCSNYACIEVFDGGSYLNTPSSLNIENSVFSGGAYDGISIFGDSVITAEIHHSKIVDFSNFSIDTFGNAPKIINAEDNFWGNDTGPFHPDENPTGTGGIVGDYIDFIPFCENEKCKARDPVILIPGIMGTEIFKNFDDNKEIWPNLNKLIFSISDNFLNDLALNIDGTEDVNKPMQLGDIIRGIHLNILGVKYDSKTYEGLIKELERNGYIENTNLFVFPYDWRKSNADSAEKLKEKIDKILTDTGAEKVDLVAHSMGGLVAKKYIAENGGNKIDQLIFIGTPLQIPMRDWEID